MLFTMHARAGACRPPPPRPPRVCHTPKLRRAGHNNTHTTHPVRGGSRVSHHNLRVGRAGNESGSSREQQREGRRQRSPLFAGATSVATWGWQLSVPGPMLAARACACAAYLTCGPPCSFPPQCARTARRGELGTHPEAAPGEAPNLAPSALEMVGALQVVTDCRAII